VGRGCDAWMQWAAQHPAPQACVHHSTLLENGAICLVARRPLHVKGKKLTRLKVSSLFKQNYLGPFPRFADDIADFYWRVRMKHMSQPRGFVENTTSNSKVSWDCGVKTPLCPSLGARNFSVSTAQSQNSSVSTPLRQNSSVSTARSQNSATYIHTAGSWRRKGSQGQFNGFIYIFETLLSGHFHEIHVSKNEKLLEVVKKRTP
jgi:hypothetical protein